MKKQRIPILVILFLAVLLGCYKPGPGAKIWQVSGLDDMIETQATQIQPADNKEEPTLPVFSTTPTPNAPITLPPPRSETISYTVKSGDTLRAIARQYQVSIDQIVTENHIENPNLIDVGEVFLIPPPSLDLVAPSFKIIPDSELIYSPSNANFDISSFVSNQNGYLAAYSEEVDTDALSGSQILQRVALEYSVNPRLLLAVLEFQSRWVTEKSPDENTLIYPMGYYDTSQAGLYKQLGWAANLLNEGYYLWKLSAISIWTLSDSTVIQVDPTINPGTAGVLNLMRNLTQGVSWDQAISANGIFATYYHFFGYPFDFAIEPLIPADLTQPEMQLPFVAGDIWSFTGGPHGGWASGSAWAAIDFAPPGEALGCFPSDAWVVASASGEIVYSDHGAVIQDLDGDGIWQAGWSIFYMHIDTNNRVAVGEYLEAGDRIGHPSCEGGYSTGTHLHIARRYNGEWIAADSKIPMVLDGWSTTGYGVEYDGYLVKGDEMLEAWNGRSPLNAIER